MRSPHQLVHSRARARQRCALFPLEGYPTSRLPSWPDAEVRVLASPALGSEFVQYRIRLQPGQGTNVEGDKRIEWFFYVLSGAVECRHRDNALPETWVTGSYLFFGCQDRFELHAVQPTELLVLRKVFEPHQHGARPGALAGKSEHVESTPFADNPHARLQLLIPDDLQYDMAMNIFTFDPGHGLPYVETHVMEHGLLMLEGKGMYYLDGEWMEVEKDDFIWMGPYCPQSFYATGPTPAKYIYYKNVNREIAL